MLQSYVILAAGFALPPAVQAVTLQPQEGTMWVDSSCFNFRKFQPVLAETLSMAFKATQRLDHSASDPQGPYWETVYETLFKSNDTRSQVRGESPCNDSHKL